MVVASVGVSNVVVVADVVVVVVDVVVVADVVVAVVVAIVSAVVVTFLCQCFPSNWSRKGETKTCCG